MITYEGARTDGVGNGEAKIFPFPFKIFSASHLKVYITESGGQPKLCEYGQDYTIEGIGEESGSVCFTTPPPDQSQVTILRQVPITQDTNYVDNDVFPAETHEQQMDKIVMMISQLQEIINRTIHYDVQHTAGSPTFPEPESGKVLGWDDEGNFRNIAISPGDTAAVITAPGDLIVGDNEGKPSRLECDYPCAVLMSGYAPSVFWQGPTDERYGVLCSSTVLHPYFAHPTTAGSILAYQSDLVRWVAPTSYGSILIINDVGEAEWLSTSSAGSVLQVGSDGIPSWLGSAASNSILVSGSTSSRWLAPGADGQVLTIVSGAPEWSAPPDAIPPSPQCRLTLTNGGTSGDIKLVPCGGNKILINGVVRTIPTEGVTVGSPSVGAGQTGYVYAYWDGSKIALETSTIGHTTGTSGIEVKSGEHSKTLVGMYHCDGSGIVNADGKVWLISLYNQRNLTATATLGGPIYSTSGTWTEIGGTSGRVSFLCWEGDAVLLIAEGARYHTGTKSVANCIAVDGNITESYSCTKFSTARYPSAYSITLPIQLSEGLHYASQYGNNIEGSGTAGWVCYPTYGFGSVGLRLNIKAMVRG